MAKRKNHLAINNEDYELLKLYCFLTGQKMVDVFHGLVITNEEIKDTLIKYVQGSKKHKELIVKYLTS